MVEQEAVEITAALFSNEEKKHRVNSRKPLFVRVYDANKRGNLEPSMVNEIKVAMWVQRLGVRTRSILSTSALLRSVFEKMLSG